ncbi:hypothetical protein [Gabonibacter massiliensis]|uniref:hypothetical protein n=1 Tax=Gabonibacter massiliensis TaxID=1720195 RepID=UPI00073EB75C|nr:hypothetical protein [Gabonibacter massiliensis]
MNLFFQSALEIRSDMLFLGARTKNHMFGIRLSEEQRLFRSRRDESLLYCFWVNAESEVRIIFL